jgi:hypothetical protein
MTPPDWKGAVAIFREWQDCGIFETGPAERVEQQVLELGGEWCDNTGGHVPVGFLPLEDGTVATFGMDSLLRWPRGRFPNLEAYLDADCSDEAGEPLESEWSES